MPGTTIPIKDTIDKIKGWYSLPIKNEQYAIILITNPEIRNTRFLIKTPVNADHIEKRINMKGTNAIPNFPQKKKPATIKLTPIIALIILNNVPIIFFDLTAHLFFL